MKNSFIILICLICGSTLFAALRQQDMRSVDEILKQKKQEEIVRLTPEQIKQRNREILEQENHKIKTTMALPPKSHIKKYPKLKESLENGNWGEESDKTLVPQAKPSSTRPSPLPSLIIIVFCSFLFLIFVRLHRLRTQKA